VPAALAALTNTLPFNNVDQVEQVFQKKGRQIACVILEPVPANAGLYLPKPGFLEGLQALCQEYGALLIFDEVMTGFRLARGGFQELCGIKPDLTALGKVIGGGLPVGAFGGRADLMDQLAPIGPVYQAGTLSGNPLAVAAGLAALKKLDDAAYLRLSSITDRLAEGLRGAAAAADVPVQVVAQPGLFTVFFSAEPVTNYAGAQAADRDRYGAWCRALLARGVYPPPSQFEAWFPSLAHDETHIDRTLEAAAAAFAEIA
jgi:glutamate-1-semialdehyde 2,1-aminomutase